VKKIQLTQGKVALVDDEDFEALTEHKWYAQVAHGLTCAARNIPRPDGGQTNVTMQREVMAAKLGRPLAKSERVIHVDENRLNNRRENLELMILKTKPKKKCKAMSGSDFEAKLSRWKNRGPKLREVRGGYGRLIGERDDEKFSEALARQKRQNAARMKQITSSPDPNA
jgi:hypothetical protein